MIEKTRGMRRLPYTKPQLKKKINQIKPGLQVDELNCKELQSIKARTEECKAKNVKRTSVVIDGGCNTFKNFITKAI